MVQSCIHCHQIGDAQRELARTRKEPFPEQLLFSYPHPKILGLILDPKERATVLELEEGSLADKAGFRRRDRILKPPGAQEGRAVANLAQRIGFIRLLNAARTPRAGWSSERQLQVPAMCALS